MRKRNVHKVLKMKLKAVDTLHFTSFVNPIEGTSLLEAMN